ncbi:hypothetical protein [Acetobacter sp.]|jgi:ABC-type spermidine/putrescine transport system permease subunit II|uniref:hypothetical protein n=1 Tax=Acetobacter sp. TaxID=440 RepID=UPI0025C4E761|nr:hypothetical protein [Acetobacter sp.]MCH4092163.1 hypothetical protein [Acetobacter sp.]MCI1299920.1 hypothetical protein [Acetobacter sp.]MCI1315938.1 hypothetical protein [Acetobacter sp.]
MIPLPGFPPGVVATHAIISFVAAILMAALCLATSRSQIWYFLTIAFWIPDILAAFLLPSLVLSSQFFPREPIPTLISIIQGFLISPSLTLPLMGALVNAQPDVTRTARSLGANWSSRASLLWLPLLRRRMILGSVATALLAVIMTFALLWRPLAGP